MANKLSAKYTFCLNIFRDLKKQIVWLADDRALQGRKMHNYSCFYEMKYETNLIFLNSEQFILKPIMHSNIQQPRRIDEAV